MPDNSYDVKAAYRVVKMLFVALISAPVILLAVALYITPNPESQAFDLSEPINLGIIILTLVSIFAGNYFSRRTFEKVTPDSDTRSRMATFQTGFIIRLASYEGIAFFSIVAFILTSNLLVLLFTAIAFLETIRSYPSPSRIKRGVGINETDLL